MSVIFVKFLHDDRAATAIEYALIAGLVVLAIVASIQLLSESLSDLYFYVSTNVLASMGSGG
jgi:pilus assembly protein Flp/PilA